MAFKEIDPNAIPEIVEKAARVLSRLSHREQAALFRSIRRYEIVYPAVMDFKGDISKDFAVQKAFNFLYQLRLHRNPTDQYAEYYRIFETLRQPEHVSKRKFDHVLAQIYAATNAWHYSFATKMLHSLDDSMPIFDRKVRLFFGIPASSGELSERAKHYESFSKIMAELLAREEVTDLFQAFDERVGALARISPMKKLDFILWKLPERQDRDVALSAPKQSNAPRKV